jgi:cupin 2 domain-containing protein
MEGTGDKIKEKEPTVSDFAEGSPMMPGNLFCLPVPVPEEEVVEVLSRRDGVRIERIVSTGQHSPAGFWYDQTEEEWVFLLQGQATMQWEDGSLTELSAGDWLLIPARKKHRVDQTSVDPPCIWLAVFLQVSGVEKTPSA